MYLTLFYLECPAGTFSVNCNQTCPNNYFGHFCTEICNCSAHQYCDSVKGCTSNNSGTDNRQWENGCYRRNYRLILELIRIAKETNTFPY